ncbi:hypothetical protein [Sabulicella rubraurantiaca]|uniref:hypothetical protein n=1 Tax=Sabulicella rubraurantiaca TaxID=2811429 RepID=UPI001A9583B5|nr:hypothetical protein [Sabulicella rubraurantiaca]
MIIDKTKVAKDCLAEHAEYLDHESKSEGFHQLEDPDGLMVMAPTAGEFAVRVLAEGEALGARTGLGALSIVISPGEGKTLSARDWIEVIDITLEVLGWEDSPRKAVLHDKDRPVSQKTGLAALPQHMHLEVPGYEPVIGLRRSLHKFSQRGELAARCIENYLGHRHVLGNHAQANERELRELAEGRTEFDRPLSYDPAATAAGIREEAARQLRDAGQDPSDDPDTLMAAWTKHCSPRQLRDDPARKAEAEGINVEKIAAAFHRAWSEASSGAEFIPLFFKGRCAAYGLQLAMDERGNVLGLDGEGKCHSLTAYMQRVQEAGLDAKNPVDTPALLTAMKKMRLPSLAEARRKAIPAARKAYTKERGILGRQRGLARKKKDLATEQAAEAAIEALDRRSLPLLTSPNIKPPSGDGELRKGNVHFGSHLPEGLLVRGEGPVDCDRAVEAFRTRMTSKVLKIDIRGGRREDHLELTRAALKRGLTVEGGYETRTPGFVLMPYVKAKAAPAVAEQPIEVEPVKPQTRDEDIIVLRPLEVRHDPAKSPLGEISIVGRGDGAPLGERPPMAALSSPRADATGAARQVRETDPFTARILKRNADLKARESRLQAKAASRAAANPAIKAVVPSTLTPVADARPILQSPLPVAAPAGRPQPATPPMTPVLTELSDAARPELVPSATAPVGPPIAPFSPAAISIEAPKTEAAPVMVLTSKDAAAASHQKPADDYASQRTKHEKAIMEVNRLIAEKCAPALRELEASVTQLSALHVQGRTLREHETRWKEKGLSEEEITKKFVQSLDQKGFDPKPITESFEHVLRASEQLVDAVVEARRASVSSEGLTDEQFGNLSAICVRGRELAQDIDMPSWLAAVSTVLERTRTPSYFSEPLDVASIPFFLDINLNPSRLERRNGNKPFHRTDEELERLKHQHRPLPALMETQFDQDDPEMVRQSEAGVEIQLDIGTMRVQGEDGRIHWQVLAEDGTTSWRQEPPSEASRAIQTAKAPEEKTVQNNSTQRHTMSGSAR